MASCFGCDDIDAHVFQQKVDERRYDYVLLKENIKTNIFEAKLLDQLEENRRSHEPVPTTN